MSANVETMFSVRETPWHGLGTIVQDAPTSKDAIILAGLDWKVEGKPIYDASGKVIPGYSANTRSSDGSVLGVVGNRYSIVQNEDAFNFTDSLVGNGDVVYETAGSLKTGKQVWLLAKMPSIQMLDDEVEPYLCFMNTHDGSGAVKVCMTPVRVVCNNTLSLALRTAKRSWSARHTGSIQSKLAEARQTLNLAQQYNTALINEAERLVDLAISDMELEAIFDQMYYKEDMSSIQETRYLDMKDEFFLRYDAFDVKPYKGTKYGAMMAMTDFVDHREPMRMTSNYKENQFKKIVEGHAEVDKFYELIAA